jgi:Fe-S-cluster containining protein
MNGMDAIDQLCPNCGLCCDSTLFADVELRRGDDPRRLRKLGLDVLQKTKTKLAFTQRCACFDGRHCKIYADRPNRCRLFECGLLQQVRSGQMTAATALKQIQQARALADKVRRLLAESGQLDEAMALAHRYAEVMNAPVDFSKEGDADRRGELLMAVSDLMQRLEREFLKTTTP